MSWRFVKRGSPLGSAIPLLGCSTTAFPLTVGMIAQLNERPNNWHDGKRAHARHRRALPVGWLHSLTSVLYPGTIAYYKSQEELKLPPGVSRQQANQALKYPKTMGWYAANTAALIFLTLRVCMFGE